ncbi:MAG: hypothetical protein BMS9Abin23_0868 [Thermodesulfobacteriota bacterium]|nr:MAG: hypothetical protein BMS9Abin23_0868 [Thermodesulfobacteriota bacterium]
MGSSTSIFLGFLFGSIGAGYLLYAKKQRRISALISGVLLITFTYFIPNLLLIVIFGVFIMAAPFFIKY